MSLIVPELRRTYDRIHVIAPTEAQLCGLAEEWATDLVTSFGQGTRLEAQNLRLPEGPIRTWMAFDLGRRGQYDMRVLMTGLSLEDEPPRRNFLEASEGLFLWLPPDTASFDAWLSTKIPEPVRQNPVVVTGLSGLKDPSLRTQAHLLWLQRNFDKLLFLEKPENFLREGLEWILSF
jgi:hypothetical protein